MTARSQGAFTDAAVGCITALSHTPPSLGKNSRNKPSRLQTKTTFCPALSLLFPFVSTRLGLNQHPKCLFISQSKHISIFSLSLSRKSVYNYWNAVLYQIINQQVKRKNLNMHIRWFCMQVWKTAPINHTQITIFLFMALEKVFLITV